MRNGCISLTGGKNDETDNAKHNGDEAEKLDKDD